MQIFIGTDGRAVIQERQGYLDSLLLQISWEHFEILLIISSLWKSNNGQVLETGSTT